MEVNASEFPSVCNFVGVGGPPIHLCPKSLLFCSSAEACYRSIMAAPGPAVRMWRQRDDGTSMLPEGVPDPITLRPLLGNVVVDCTKKNQEKEVVRAGECLTKQSFI